MTLSTMSQITHTSMTSLQSNHTLTSAAHQSNQILPTNDNAQRSASARASSLRSRHSALAGASDVHSIRTNSVYSTSTIDSNSSSFPYDCNDNRPSRPNSAKSANMNEQIYGTLRRHISKPTHAPPPPPGLLKPSRPPPPVPTSPPLILENRISPPKEPQTKVNQPSPIFPAVKVENGVLQSDEARSEKESIKAKGSQTASASNDMSEENMEFIDAVNGSTAPDDTVQHDDQQKTTERKSEVDYLIKQNFPLLLPESNATTKALSNEDDAVCNAKLGSTAEEEPQKVLEDFKVDLHVEVVSMTLLISVTPIIKFALSSARKLAYT